MTRVISLDYNHAVPLHQPRRRPSRSREINVDDKIWFWRAGKYVVQLWGPNNERASFVFGEREVITPSVVAAKIRGLEPPTDTIRRNTLLEWHSAFARFKIELLALTWEESLGVGYIVSATVKANDQVITLFFGVSYVRARIGHARDPEMQLPRWQGRNGAVEVPASEIARNVRRFAKRLTSSTEIE